MRAFQKCITEVLSLIITEIIDEIVTRKFSTVVSLPDVHWHLKFDQIEDGQVFE